MPNVSGGLVTSTIEQRTDWGYDYNRELAVLAENNGFDYALSQVRYMASYGAEYQHESTSFSLALLLATQRLKVIAAVHPGLWHPGVLAKLGATADHLSGGRFAVNVVSGWFKGEFTALGEPWLEHDERYRRSEEFIRALRAIWTEDHAELAGRLLPVPRLLAQAQAPEQPGAPAPGDLPGRQLHRRPRHGRPGLRLVLHATARTSTASPSRSSDVQRLRRHRGRPRTAASASTASSSPATPRPRPATRCARSSPRPTPRPSTASATPSSRPDSPPPTARACGRTPSSRTWSSTTTASVPGLIGTPEQIAERIVAYKRLGVDLFLLGFLHYQEEVEYFGKRVLPAGARTGARQLGRTPRRARRGRTAS